ncbi:FTR1 domain-containing protein [Rhizoctonia solani AG-1 IA]|uniref:FTR1 domain-containing protein n=1 Tax=Thanatephorus cucumeris (strain AG1-IA) TaxID=983506 RepID=L8WF44_THACA|nr:FTR1 domain-containing protein [Rhizoctonia solani AG-1 IA]
MKLHTPGQRPSASGTRSTMAKNLFSLLRESLEASIIVSVLLSLVEQIVVSPDALHSESTDGLATAAAFPGRSDAPSGSTEGSGTATPDSQVKDVRNTEEPSNDNASIAIQNTTSENEAGEIRRSELLRRLRWQIVLGAGLGLLLALVIGAAFVAVWFIKVVDLFSAAEEIWEGVFSLIAWGADVIYATVCYRIARGIGGGGIHRWASSIPLAALAGLVIGLVVGYLIYASSSRARLSAFLITSTSLLLLIGAGLMSKAVGAFERHRFNVMVRSELALLESYIDRVPVMYQVGGDVAEAGDGPGSFDVVGNICWLVTVGTVISYIAYWLIAILALVRMKHREVRILHGQLLLDKSLTGSQGRTTIVNKFVNVTGHSRFRNAIRKRNVERRAQSTELSS